MSSAVIPATPAEDDAHFRTVLRTLVDQAAQLATDLVADKTLTPVAKTAPYERLARSIRRSVALSRHIAANPYAPAKPATSPEQARTDARRTILRDVENTIARAETADRSESPERWERWESLRAELHERLDDPALDLALTSRPPHDIATELKQDLGLAPANGLTYPRRTPADIRALEARAAAPPAQPASNREADQDAEEGIPTQSLDAESAAILYPGQRRNGVLDRLLLRPDDG